MASWQEFSADVQELCLAKVLRGKEKGKIWGGGSLCVVFVLVIVIDQCLNQRETHLNNL